MHWADRIAGEIIKKKKDKIAAGRPLVIRDEKTMSGSPHLGSLRGVAIHGLLSEILSERKIANRYLFEINDFDLFDSVPAGLDREKFSPHLGKLLFQVPAPEPWAKNYAEYFAAEFKRAIEQTGFQPEFYLSSDLYRSGRLDQAIKTALDNSQLIKKIYRESSGSLKGDWFPLSVVCPGCGKLATTKVVAWNGRQVEYLCGDFVNYAKGCGGRGWVSPFAGRAKLPWKVEWAAKFQVLAVDIEGAGKDHSTKGGAREAAEQISLKVFNYQPPFDIPYEFFQAGGRKMSSSKGLGSTAKETAELLPTEILRLLLLEKEPQRVIEFAIVGQTVPTLFDSYDWLAEHFFGRGQADDYCRLFALIHPVKDRSRLKKKFLVRFSLISFLSQMPHFDFWSQLSKLKGGKLEPLEIEAARQRRICAEKWLKLYAPPKYRFELQSTLPAAAKDLTVIQKAALQKILDFVKSSPELDGSTIHQRLHQIKKETQIEAGDFFAAIYLIFLGRVDGPKAGWFLNVLDKKFLINRLEEAINS